MWIRGASRIAALMRAQVDRLEAERDADRPGHGAGAERKRVLVLETTRRRSGLTQHVCSSAAPTHAQFAHLH